MISAILAVSENGVIGKDGKLPWPHIPEDMKWFMNITLNNVVVMGSKTWFSLGIKKPLPNRLNYVVTTQPASGFIEADGVICGKNLCEELIGLALQHPQKDITIIGGANIYNQCFPLCEKIYLTKVYGKYDGDTYIDMETVLQDFELQSEQNVPNKCVIQVWVRK